MVNESKIHRPNALSGLCRSFPAVIGAAIAPRVAQFEPLM